MVALWESVPKPSRGQNWPLSLKSQALCWVVEATVPLVLEAMLWTSQLSLGHCSSAAPELRVQCLQTSSQKPRVTMQLFGH